MSVRTYNQIITKAKECINNVKNNQELGIYSQWGYYFANAILTPKKNIKRNKSLKQASKPTGNYISRQIGKTKYINMAHTLVNYCNKHGQMPNSLEYKSNKKLSEKVYVLMFANILVAYDKKGKLPSEINVNSKAFVKPTETGNVVYDYFVKKTGKRPQTMDEILQYVCDYFYYEGYSDDKYSNKEVMDKKAGNCVDLLQWLINMLKPLEYDCKCIHVQCRVSGTGHVFGKFRHKKYTENTWVIRDPSAVCQNSIHNVWCEDGYRLAEDPDWFLENLNR